MTTTLVKFVAVAAFAAASASTAFAASAARGDSPAAARTPSQAQSKQQSRMASCNQDAVGKKGDERRAFMKQCLSSGTAKAKATKADAAADGSAKPSRRKAAQ